MKSIGILTLPLLFALANTASLAGVSTVALLSGEGERAPGEAVIARVEVALSATPGLAVVERQQIHRILAEQSLTVSGLANAATAAHVGRLLAADFFLFVQRMPEGTNQVTRWRVVESRTGIALAHGAAETPLLATNAAPVLATVREAIVKSQVLAKDRHYVGVLGFRSEEIGHSLEALAGALEGWLAFDLAAVSNVIILDREHLEHLTAEENLAGLDLQLRASAVLIEATLKRRVDSPPVEVRTSLRSFGPEASDRFVLPLATNDLVAMRQALVRAVCDRLRVAAPARGSFDPAQEAALFDERAQMLFWDGQWDGAVSAAEAALALHRTQERRLGAARMRWGIINRTNKMLQGEKLILDQHRVPNPPTGLKLYKLRHAVRGAELTREALDYFVAENRGQTNCALVWPLYIRTPELMAWDTNEPEVVFLRREWQRHALAGFRMERDYRASLWNCPCQRDPRQGDPPQGRWALLVAGSLLRLADYTDDVHEWAGLLRETVDSFLHPPGPYTCLNKYGAPPGGVQFWYYLSICAPVAHFHTPQEREVIRQTFEPFTRDPNPAFRLAGLNALRSLRPRINDKQDLEGIRGVLDFFIREMPYNDPVRVQNADYWFPGLLLSGAVCNLGWDETEKYGRAILEPILKAKDGVRLCSWELLIERWFMALRQLGKAEEARQKAEEFLALLDPGVKQRCRGNFEGVRGGLAAICHPVAPSGEKWPEEWATYSLSLVSANTIRGYRLDTAVFDAGNVFMVWSHRANQAQATFRVTAMPVTGGSLRALGEVTIKDTVLNPWEPTSVALVVDGETAWMGTHRNGLIRFGMGAPTIMMETNGLPADDVWSMALLSGKLYLGFNGGLAGLNLTNSAITVLASARSTDARTPLDGQVFSIPALLADVERNCLWVSANANSGPLHGVWRVPLDGGNWEKVFAPPAQAVRRLTRHQGVILAGAHFMCVDRSVGAIDPGDRHVTWLLVNRAREESQHPRFGPAVSPHEHFWLWYDPELITAGDVLRLRTLGKPEIATLSRATNGTAIGNIVAFEEVSPGEILFATARGELWRLRRTPHSPDGGSTR